MRGLAVLCVPDILLTSAGCRENAEPVREDGPAIMLSAADPRAGTQLIKGFYPLDGTHRWTERTFAAKLRPPKNAAARGAVLVLRFGVPETVIQTLHTVRISASVEGAALAPAEFTQPGDHTYSRDVPANALVKPAVIAEFTLDKALPVGPDSLEHGVNVSTGGLEAK